MPLTLACLTRPDLRFEKLPPVVTSILFLTWFGPSFSTWLGTPPSDWPALLHKSFPSCLFCCWTAPYQKTIFIIVVVTTPPSIIIAHPCSACGRAAPMPALASCDVVLPEPSSMAMPPWMWRGSRRRMGSGGCSKRGWRWADEDTFLDGWRCSTHFWTLEERMESIDTHFSCRYIHI